MRQAAGMPTLGAWYDHLEAGLLLNLVRKEVRVKRLHKKEARQVERLVTDAYSRDSTRVFAKRTDEVDGELRIVADPPLIVPGATLYARICGATLARAHARWGDRIAIASYLGRGDWFDQAIADFSSVYADQNERDYAAFTAAVSSGRLIARTGV
jgi:Uncharacterized protein conserved in bacteria (DUF2252)